MDEEDTFAEWLFYRFQAGGRVVLGKYEEDVVISKGDEGMAWRSLSEEDRMFWQHEADAVRRAEKRGGFKRG